MRGMCQTCGEALSSGKGLDHVSMRVMRFTEIFAIAHSRRSARDFRMRRRCRRALSRGGGRPDEDQKVGPPAYAANLGPSSMAGSTSV